MIPCLYDASETAYTTNGIGKLADTESCTVEEKRNSSYELKMTYPADGIHAESIAENNIILAKPSVTGADQPFRIYKVTTNLSGELEVQARHISYQLNFTTVSPFSVTGCANAMSGLKSHAATDCPFSFETDIESTASFKLSTPSSVRNALGGIDGSVLDTFGGEYEWDGYTVKLHKKRGADNGVRIVYGKNLTDFKMESSIENTITGVHPYWVNSEDSTVMELSEKIVTVESSSPYQKITALDCSSEFQEKPSESSLREYAQSYLKDTSLTEPEVDIAIDFIQLWNTPGYEDVAEAEAVSLCDTVHVYITKLGLEVSSKVTETIYDVLLERYTGITLSNSTVSSRNSSLTASLNSIRNTATVAYNTAVSVENNMSGQIGTVTNCCKLDGELLSGLFGLHYESRTESGQAVRYVYDGSSLSKSSNAWKNSDGGFFYSSNGGKSWGYAWEKDVAVKTAILLQATLDELDERYKTATALSEELLEELDERYKEATALSSDLYIALDKRYGTATKLSTDLQKQLDAKYEAAIPLTEPKKPTENSLWIDTENKRLKLWDGEAWVVIGYEPEEMEPTDPETPTDTDDTTETDTPTDTTETDTTADNESGGEVST